MGESVGTSIYRLMIFCVYTGTKKTYTTGVKNRSGHDTISRSTSLIGLWRDLILLKKPFGKNF
jgi:hypothetical protein